MEYHWRFLAFANLWFRKRSTQEMSLVLLCFDLREEKAPPSGSMHVAFVKELNMLDHEQVLKCPYSIYVPLLDIVVSQFNRATWTFRVPVRNVEKVSGISLPHVQWKVKRSCLTKPLMYSQTSLRSLSRPFQSKWLQDKLQCSLCLHIQKKEVSRTKPTMISRETVKRR